MSRNVKMTTTSTFKGLSDDGKPTSRYDIVGKIDLIIDPENISVVAMSVLNNGNIAW